MRLSTLITNWHLQTLLFFPRRLLPKTIQCTVLINQFRSCNFLCYVQNVISIVKYHRSNFRWNGMKNLICRYGVTFLFKKWLTLYFKHETMPRIPLSLINNSLHSFLSYLLQLVIYFEKEDIAMAWSCKNISRNATRCQ